MSILSSTRTITVSLFGLMVAVAVAADSVTPIPDRGSQRGVRDFIGETAVADPIAAMAIPQNPNMATNGRSNIHMDTFMSDTYTTGGPLGDPASEMVSSVELDAECGTVTFDAEGRVIAVCIGIRIPVLYLFDPDSLETIATYTLPQRPQSDGLGAGGYFYLDEEDRAVVPTADNTIVAIEYSDIAGQFVEYYSCDVSTAVGDDTINSILPDQNGLIWFLSTGGVVGTVDPNDDDNCNLQYVQLEDDRGREETVAKSFAVDSSEDGGTFIVTDSAMYRFSESGGEPVIEWRKTYDRGLRIKPGQLSRGSGTTPTLIGDSLVTITDNADPYEHVLVYDRSNGDLICKQRLFTPFPFFNSTFNSLIAFVHGDDETASIIVENNYGYRSERSTEFGGTTVPGIERVDVDLAAGACYKVWGNYKLSIPTVVSNLSLETGLIYTYSKPRGPFLFTNPWYFTAVDFRTGETVYRQLAGTGFGYNNNYSGVYLAPNGVAYVGVLGGLVRIGPGGGD